MPCSSSMRESYHRLFWKRKRDVAISNRDAWSSTHDVRNHETGQSSAAIFQVPSAHSTRPVTVGILGISTSTNA